MPVVPVPISDPDPIDLATGSYVSQVLLAGGVTLNTAQAAILGKLITAASREIIRYCNRKFGLATYTEIVPPEGTRQDRGEPASAKLSAFPVQSVASVLTGRSGVLTVKNGDTSTNQFATVAFTISGDVEYHDLTYVGLSLSRTASGATTAVSLAFSSYVTLESLSAAINSLGNGWSATVQSSYEKFPSASLVGVREPKDALSNGATLDMFTKAASGYDIERATGIVRCGLGGGGFGGWGGDPWNNAWDGLGGCGGSWGWGQLRVEYTAGWSVIPENLQQVCAEVVKGMYARLDGDPSLKSETADKYSWTAKDAVTNLPEWATSVLGYYKDWSV